MNETVVTKEKFKSPISVIVGSLIYILLIISPSFNNSGGLMNVMTSSEERQKAKDERPNYCASKPEYQKECLINPSLESKSGSNNVLLISVIYLLFFIIFIMEAFKNSKYYKKENSLLLNSALIIHSSLFLIFGWNWNSFLMGSSEGYSFYEFVKYYIIPLI